MIILLLIFCRPLTINLLLISHQTTAILFVLLSPNILLLFSSFFWEWVSAVPNYVAAKCSPKYIKHPFHFITPFVLKLFHTDC